MSEILSDENDGLAGRGKPAGGCLAPLLVVVVVALLCSGVLSTDPEPRSSEGFMMIPTSAQPTPVDVGEAPALAPAGLVDDPDDFVEFGFDSQFGVVPPRGEPAASVPALHPPDSGRPVRPM